jgi:hypothetical protein
VGATDPAALAVLRDGPRCVLPRVSALGALVQLVDADADYARRRAVAAHAATAPEAARPALDGLIPYRIAVECVIQCTLLLASAHSRLKLAPQGFALGGCLQRAARGVSG